jgi:hypothetical protein
MEKTNDEAVADYLAMLTEHVSADFAEATDIMNLLKGKAMKVFVPVSWDGINGLEPLKLTWKPGKPTHRKPRARPVNPKLNAHAKVEFERFLQYFYEPSTSSVACCLVIAPKVRAQHPSSGSVATTSQSIASS